MPLWTKNHKNYAEALAGDDSFKEDNPGCGWIDSYPSSVFMENNTFSLTAKDIATMTGDHGSKLYRLDKVLDAYPKEKVDSKILGRYIGSFSAAMLLTTLLQIGVTVSSLGPNEIRDSSQGVYVLHTRGTVETPSLLLINQKNEVSVLDCTFIAKDQSSPEATCTMVSPEEALAVKDQELVYYKVPFDKINPSYQSLCNPTHIEEHKLEDTTCRNLENIKVEHPFIPQMTLSRVSRVFQGENGASRSANFSSPLSYYSPFESRVREFQDHSLFQKMNELEKVKNSYDPQALKAPENSHVLVSKMALMPYATSFVDLLPTLGSLGLAAAFYFSAARRTRNKAQDKVSKFKEDIGFNQAFRNV